MAHGNASGTAAPGIPNQAAPKGTSASAGNAASALGGTMDQPGTPDRSGRWPLFDHNPELAAPMELMAAVQGHAKAAAPRSLVDRHARITVALDTMANLGGDAETRVEAITALEGRLHMLAAAPALSADDVAPKLAGLVLELARSSHHGNLTPSPVAFILASCALADLTMLRLGVKIPLPPRALEPVNTPGGYRLLAPAGGEGGEQWMIPTLPQLIAEDDAPLMPCGMPYSTGDRQMSRQDTDRERQFQPGAPLDHGNHNPLVGGSNPPAATIPAIP